MHHQSSGVHGFVAARGQHLIYADTRGQLIELNAAHTCLPVLVIFYWISTCDKDSLVHLLHPLPLCTPLHQVDPNFKH